MNEESAHILRKLLCQRSEFQSQYNNDAHSTQTRFDNAMSRFCGSFIGEHKNRASQFRQLVHSGVKSTPDNGYHNKIHAKAVVASTIAILESFYGVDVAPGVASNKPADTAAYVVAAAFHDARHSGGRLPDSANVQRAVLHYLDTQVTPGFEEWLELDCVPDMIQSTVFDPATYAGDVTKYALRDADLIGFMYSEHPEQLAGLAQELGLKIETEEQGLEFLHDHYKFYRSLTLHTEYAKGLVEDYLNILGKIVLPEGTNLVYVLRDSREVIFESRFFHNDLKIMSYSPDSKRIKPQLIALSAEEYPAEVRPVVCSVVRQANIARTFEHLFELTKWREAKAAYEPPTPPQIIPIPKCNSTAVFNRTVDHCIGEISRVTQYLTAEGALDSAYNLLYDMTDSISKEYLKEFKWPNKTK